MLRPATYFCHVTLPDGKGLARNSASPHPARPAAMVERDQLEALSRGDDPPDRDRLRSHMYELRRSVDGSFYCKLIQSIPRRGYRIASPHAPM